MKRQFWLVAVSKMAFLALLVAIFGGTTRAYAEAGINELFMSHPEVLNHDDDGNQYTVLGGGINRINLAMGGPPTRIFSPFGETTGLAVDAAGNLYFGNETTNPIQVELWKLTPGGSLTSFGNVVDTSAGYVSLGYSAFDLAVNRASKELFFNHPEVSNHDDDGNRYTVRDGTIEKIDLTTGQRSTVASSLNSPTGLSVDAAGNLYFGNETNPPIQVELWKLTPGGSLTSLGNVVDTSAGYVSLGYSAFDLAYDPGQRVLLDWDTQLDVTILKFTDNSTNPPSVTYIPIPQPSPTVPFSPTDKDKIFLGVQDIVLNSEIDMPILDSRLYSLPPPQDAVRVRFSPYGAGLLGIAYEGNDQCNRRKNDNVAVFGNPKAGDSTKLMAEITAHEGGHALGLRHIDPFPTLGIEVMDYTEPPSSITEKFTQGVYEITEDLAEPQPYPTGDFHNPIYHIRAYSFGESRTDLESEGVFPGTNWDTDCDSQSSSSSIRVSFIDVQVDGTIYNLTAQQQIGQTPAAPDDVGLLDDPKWETVSYIGTIIPDTISGKEVIWRRRFPLRLVGSSTEEQELDLFFGYGTPSNPELTIDPSATGMLTGSVFQFRAGTQIPSVVGSFTIELDEPEPSCSSPPADVVLLTGFSSGYYLCVGDSSIRTEPASSVVIQPDAKVDLRAPIVEFFSGFGVGTGGVLSVITQP